jgi:hypothetical protein
MFGAGLCSPKNLVRKCNNHGRLLVESPVGAVVDPILGI